MATVVNNPGAVERERVVSDSGAGWAVAVLVLLAAIAIAGYVWVQRAVPAQTPVENPGANINVTLPEAGTPATNPSGNASETQPPATNPTTP